MEEKKDATPDVPHSTNLTSASAASPQPTIPVQDAPPTDEQMKYSMAGLELPKSGYAIASLVLGAISFFFMGIISGPAAIVLGYIALQKIKTGQYGGKNMAIVGIVLGAITTIINLLLLIALLVMIFVNPGSAGYRYY